MQIKRILISVALVVLGLAAFAVINMGHQLRHTGFMGPGHLDFSARLAGDYWIHRTSSIQIAIAPDSWSEGTPLIPATVAKCATDGRFIIAERVEAMLDSGTSDGASKFDYWILDTRTPKLWGPLSLETFTTQRLALGIGDELKLRDASEFRLKDDSKGSPSDLSH